MTSSKPYLVRALYEWIVDNRTTPYLLVDSEYPRVKVPAGYASDGQIVLNVSPSAVRGLELGNEVITFEGRFGGVSHNLYIPCGAVMAIYARENGQGMVFESDPVPPASDDDAGASPQSDATKLRQGGRPSLKVIK